MNWIGATFNITSYLHGGFALSNYDCNLQLLLIRYATWLKIQILYMTSTCESTA